MEGGEPLACCVGSLGAWLLGFVPPWSGLLLRWGVLGGVLRLASPCGSASRGLGGARLVVWSGGFAWYLRAGFRGGDVLGDALRIGASTCTRSGNKQTALVRRGFGALS